MPEGFKYSRRTGDKVTTSTKIGEIFGDWVDGRERWMFVSAHDDDIIVGAGLTFLAALAEGVEVHALITTDGRMGYCRFPQRRTIAQIRAKEAEESFRILGLLPDRLHRLQFPDCNLNPYRGRHFTTIGDPTELEGASGLQNAFPHVLRLVRPTRVFLPTVADLHPDHRIVHEEMLISLFHAQGAIWPELGLPIETVPKAYEYATYCDFPELPQIRIEVPPALLDRKLDGIRAYASQEQIGLLVDEQRKAGPIEYIREMHFQFYSPQKYHALFSGNA
jgi:LmbE family N-acetylglucosaminyl deacetylase